MMKTLKDKAGRQKVSLPRRKETVRRQVKNVAATAEESFRNVFDGAALGIVIADSNRNYLAVNDRFCEITGYSREMLLAKSGRQIAHPDDWAMVESGIGRVVRGESKVFSCDLRCIHADQSVIWVHAQATVFQEDPHSGARIMIAVEDITRRRRVEEELHRVEANLRSVLDSSHDVIYRLNVQTGRYEYISPSCEAVLGYSADEIRDLGAAAVKALIHPDDLPELEEKLDRLAVSDREEVEGRYLRMGEYRWLSNRMFLIRDSSGRPMFRDGTIRDITDRKRAEANRAFMSNIQDELVRLTSVEDIMQSVGAKIGAFLDLSFSFFAEIDAERDTARLKYVWHAEDVPRLPETIRLSDFVRAEFYQALQNDEIFIIRDTDTDLRNNPAAFRAVRMRSFIVVPFYRYTEWKTLLVIADSRSREWCEDEVNLVREISNRVFPRLERARAEAAMRESEEKYSRIVNTASEGIVLTDRQKRILYVNEVFANMLGCRADEMLGRSGLDFVSGDDFKTAARNWENSKSDVVAKYDLRLRKKDGSKIWVMISATPFNDSQGNYLGSLAMFTDINERKLMETELKEAEERFRNFFETPLTATAISIPGKGLSEVNDQMCSMLGYSREELLAMNSWEMVHPDDIGTNVELYKKIIAGEIDKYSLDLRFIRRDGAVIWTNLAAGCLRNDDGSLKQVSVSLLDITQRKEAEEELRKARDELEIRVRERTADLEEVVKALTEKEQLLAVESHRLQETNTALKVLLEHREEDQKLLERNVISNVRKLVLPYVEKLNLTSLSPVQEAYVDVIKANLQNIVSPFMQNLTAVYMGLTPREIEVCNLVVEGKSAKDIALLLNTSNRSIEFYKENIRRKLGLTHTKTNLRTHLLSLSKKSP